MKKLDKFGQVSEESKALLKTAREDQIIECFPNTLLKLLPAEIGKTKWNKKAKDVENWGHWWEMHDKVNYIKVFCLLFKSLTMTMTYLECCCNIFVCYLTTLTVNKESLISTSSESLFLL